MLELSANITTNTPTMFAVMNRSSAGSGHVTFLTLQNNLWLARGSTTNQWGMHNNLDVLSGTTLDATYRVLTAVERNFNDIDLATDGTSVTRTTGTGFHGKALGTLGSNNNGVTNTGLQFFHGNIGEVIVYNTNLNRVQIDIVENALAAKYGLTLTAVDVYTMDNPVNGNFDYDVAGIARYDAANQHLDAKGRGIVRIYNASGLGDDEGFLWGHNNIALNVSSTDVPAGVQSRLAREWGVSEVGDVGSITMQFDLSGLYGSITPTDLRLLVDHDADGIYNEAGTIALSGATAISCNNYVFTGVAAFNGNMRFTIGTVNFTQTPLPIELVRFEGEVLAASVQLSWTTESELNNDYFTIERSVSGQDFKPVGKVEGAGTSKAPISYEFIDEVIFSGGLYYRLKQTDFDGTKTYSDIIRVTRQSSETVSVFPNPLRTGESIQVQLTEAYMQRGPYNVSLYDAMSKALPAEVNQAEEGALTINPSASLLPGMYILKISLPETGKTIVRRLSVIR